jgi:hypothetical protein
MGSTELPVVELLFLSPSDDSWMDWIGHRKQAGKSGTAGRSTAARARSFGLRGSFDEPRARSFGLRGSFDKPPTGTGGASGLLRDATRRRVRPWELLRDAADGPAEGRGVPSRRPPPPPFALGGSFETPPTAVVEGSGFLRDALHRRRRGFGAPSRRPPPPSSGVRGSFKTPPTAAVRPSGLLRDPRDAQRAGLAIFGETAGREEENSTQGREAAEAQKRRESELFCVSAPLRPCVEF